MVVQSTQCAWTGRAYRILCMPYMSDLCMVDLIKAASRFTSLLQYSRFHDPVLDFKSIPKYFANKISYSALFIFSKFRCRIIYIPVERGLYLNSPYDCKVSSVTWRTLVMNIIIFNCSYLDKERKLWLNQFYLSHASTQKFKLLFNSKSTELLNLCIIGLDTSSTSYM